MSVWTKHKFLPQANTGNSHSPFSTGHNRGLTPFSMEKLSCWLLYFLILHSLFSHSSLSKEVWQPLMWSFSWSLHSMDSPWWEMKNQFLSKLGPPDSINSNSRWVHYTRLETRGEFQVYQSSLTVRIEPKRGHNFLQNPKLDGGGTTH